ncbi:phenylacetate-CoA ligase [Desulfacinum hydrothermale DSM 13146]|uniref:Phenylacetate-CoA ligase n=1 Tax=Desulfacinum hydrothermale DSM 13146 TaxID=1121390 RepID=A0A1W1X2R1_9BACT|nr:AMP-binding protein [Desulfacinum hydrothermale]SMC17691.1 phenylacetate-CoA ligase [Desulfacinum hydrothermale DSM 13146]
MAVKERDVKGREEIRQIQLERLQMTLNRAYLNVDFYRARMDSLGMVPEDVETEADLRRFPFTTSQDLADHYPYGLFAVPLKSVVRLKIATSRDGRPIVVGFTRRDVNLWQSLMARLFRRLGITDRDIVQVAFNYSLFPGAFTFNHAAEAIGATLAPSATVSARLQLQIMRDFRSTVLATTPSFALHLLDTLDSDREAGRNHHDLHLKLMILGPDPTPEGLRQRIRSTLGLPVYGLYGVSEMVEPGLAGECPTQDGFHAAEDHFLLEVVHPVTGLPVERGEEGELVVTTLSAEAYPLIRYRTGDVVRQEAGPCPCGQATLRLSPVIRRTDNRVSVRGIPIYPERVGKILRAVDPSIDDYRLVVGTRYGLGDTLEVRIAHRIVSGRADGTHTSRLEEIRSRLRRELGLGVRVQEVPPERMPQEGLTLKTVFREKV